MQIKKRNSNTSFLSSLLSKCLIFLLFLVQASCSDDSDHNKERIRAAHLEQIDFAKQKECNEMQKFYDNLDQGGSVLKIIQ